MQVITLQNIAKTYRMYKRDIDRVREIITGRSYHDEQEALSSLNIEVQEGEVVGVVGRNGAGKSTLLKILAGTIQPSTGTVRVEGRIASLLELGASFHPEMTGHENIYLYCSIQGISHRETQKLYKAIVDFSGISLQAIHRPVKTYSSGMFIRLAFAAATHVDPDILIIDEALSVGDGIFSRRSFDRIMQFKEQGKTIFFCSHSLYQVESLCDRVLWLEEGRIKADGSPAKVLTAYAEFLNRNTVALAKRDETSQAENSPAEFILQGESAGLPRITSVTVSVDGNQARSHILQSGVSCLRLQIAFDPGKDIPMPTLGVMLHSGDGVVVSSLGSLNDKFEFQISDDGLCHTTLEFPAIPLFKGNYVVDLYLMCERGIHVYEKVKSVVELIVQQNHAARGYVNLPHHWSN